MPFYGKCFVLHKYKCVISGDYNVFVLICSPGEMKFGLNFGQIFSNNFLYLRNIGKIMLLFYFFSKYIHKLFCLDEVDKIDRIAHV